MKKPNKNQDRIEKLKGLAQSNEDDQHKDHVDSKNIAHIIKLNEELTAENSRLLERCDELESSIAEEVSLWAKELDTNVDLQFELDGIKSKWWYKLMTWGW